MEKPVDVFLTRAKEFREKTNNMESLMDVDDIDGFKKSHDELTREYEALGKTFHMRKDFIVMYRQRLEGRSLAIVNFKEKHGDNICDVSTPDSFANTFLSVLSDRLKDGYYDSVKIYPAKACSPMIGVFVDGVMAKSAQEMIKWQEDGTVNYRATIKNWRESPTSKLLKNCKFSSDEVWCFILDHQDMLEKPHDADLDAVTAWLLYSTVVDDMNYTGSCVREYFMEKSMGPISMGLLEKMPKPSSDEVNDIIQLASEPLTFRLAGRLAYSFLSGRTQGQYEDFDILYPVPYIFVPKVENTPKP